MDRIESRTIDKTGWGDGPWQSEPDKLQWQDEATGLPCLIVRGPVGALCGYVGVPTEHPAHGLSYYGMPDAEFCAYSKAMNEKMRSAFKPYEGDAERRDWPERPALVPDVGEAIAGIKVHGGLTYSAACGDEICHVPGEGEPDNVWWFGFDCAHGFDLCPTIEMYRKEMVTKPLGRIRAYPEAHPDTYRNVAYVTAECAKLAKQLAAIHA